MISIIFFFFFQYAGLSLLWPLPLRSTGSACAGSAAMAHGPSRSAARGIFPDRGTNPCPLHRQADSQPLRHQGSLMGNVLILFLRIVLNLVLTWPWPLLSSGHFPETIHAECKSAGVSYHISKIIYFFSKCGPRRCSFSVLFSEYPTCKRENFNWLY